MSRTAWAALFLIAFIAVPEVMAGNSQSNKKSITEDPGHSSQETSGKDEGHSSQETSGKDENQPDTAVKTQQPSMTTNRLIQSSNGSVSGSSISSTGSSISASSSAPHPSAEESTIGGPNGIGPEWTWESSMEAPAGEEDMGGWTQYFYTEEQQKRLGVDKYGRKINASSSAGEKPENAEHSSTGDQQVVAEHSDAEKETEDHKDTEDSSTKDSKEVQEDIKDSSAEGEKEDIEDTESVEEQDDIEDPTVDEEQEDVEHYLSVSKNDKVEVKTKKGDWIPATVSYIRIKPKGAWRSRKFEDVQKIMTDTDGSEQYQHLKHGDEVKYKKGDEWLDGKINSIYVKGKNGKETWYYEIRKDVSTMTEESNDHDYKIGENIEYWAKLTRRWVPGKVTGEHPLMVKGMRWFDMPVHKTLDRVRHIPYKVGDDIEYWTKLTRRWVPGKVTSVHPLKVKGKRWVDRPVRKTLDQVRYPSPQDAGDETKADASRWLSNAKDNDIHGAI